MKTMCLLNHAAFILLLSQLSFRLKPFKMDEQDIGLKIGVIGGMCRQLSGTDASACLNRSFCSLFKHWW